MKLAVGDIETKDVIKYCAAAAVFSLTMVLGVWLKTSNNSSVSTMTTALIAVSLFIAAGGIYRIFLVPKKQAHIYDTYNAVLVVVLWALSCGTLLHSINNNVFDIYPDYYHFLSLFGFPAAIFFAIRYATDDDTLGKEKQNLWAKTQMISEGILIGTAISLTIWLTVFEPLGVRIQNNALGFTIIVLTLMSCSLILQIIVIQFNYFIFTAVLGYIFWAVIMVVSMVDTIMYGYIIYSHIVPIYLLVGTCLGLFVFSVSFGQERKKETNQTASRTRQNLLTMAVVFTTVMFCLSFIYQYAHFFDFAFLALILTVAVFSQEIIRSKVNNDMMNKVHTQASVDDLTGLPNRRNFGSALQNLMISQTNHYLLLINIDRFGEMNGLVGHESGDIILKTFARELEAIDEAYESTSYRLGADEFVTICSGASTHAESIAASIQRSILSCGNDFSVLKGFPMTVSVGIARITQAPAIANSAQLKAARAQVLSNGKNQTTTNSRAFLPLVQATYALRQGRANDVKVQWYTAELAKDQSRRQEVESRLSAAIANESLSFHFQPVIDIQTNQTVGFEALARWIDPQLGFISPADFIPLAERLGLVGKIGEHAIRSALAVIKAAQERGVTLSGAVNLSPIHLRNEKTPTVIIKACEQAGIDRERLVLEVTEGVFMDANDPAIATITQLHRQGFKISLDDFGSGYSSWGYLSKLPVDIIKVDRSLTQRARDQKVHVVVRSILSMCSDLNFETVVEGIEEEEERQIFSELNADTGQGWFWSKALPHDEFIEFACKSRATNTVV